MNATSTYQEMEREVSDLAARAEQLKRDMREGRIKELEAQGERLIVRPVMLPQPSHGERDPWFGLTYKDWLKFRQEGFDGWMETTEGSETPKIMIFVDKAIAWLEARCRKQAEARRRFNGATAQARQIREGRRKSRGTKLEVRS
jgi:hypothetical protein